LNLSRIPLLSIDPNLVPVRARAENSIKYGKIEEVCNDNAALLAPPPSPTLSVPLRGAPVDREDDKLEPEDEPEAAKEEAEADEEGPEPWAKLSSGDKENL
jgi:hypothetical protein